MGNAAPNLGTARGSIEIDTSQLERVRAVSRSVGQETARNLGQIDAAARRTQVSFNSLAGAFGVIWGPQAAQRIAQFAIRADEVATSYARQSVAALSLAGSQEKLNALLATYDKVTGGAIDKATLLSNVVSLQSIGFADTTAEIERFATAVRGISIARGIPQDYVQQQLQLAISNQSTMRLDQIGLGIDEVKNKVAELKAANSSLSDAQAYQNAILTIAEQKYGALTKSAVGQATGLEKARKAWADLTLEIGEAAGPATAGVMTGLTNEIRGISEMLQRVERDAVSAGVALRGMGGGTNEFRGALGDILTADPISDQLIPWLNSQLGLNRPGLPTSGFRAFGNSPSDRMRAPPTPWSLTDEQNTAVQERATALRDIERQASADRLDATRQYETQRTETIAQYELTIAREAEDFGRQRARAAAQLEKQIADVQEASAKQAQRWFEDLQERIADFQAESAKRVSKAQDDTNRQIAEIESDYRKSRERAERDHRDNLLDAAGRLDAKAVAAEQRRFAREADDQEDAHRERLSDERDKLAERIQQEKENLAERIAQEQEAHAERLADAAEADAERIADMREAHTEQLRIEDEDRATRLARMAQDHQNQLAQMASAQALRMEQINRQQAEERAALDEAHKAEMAKLGLHNKAFEDEQKRSQKAIFDEWVKFWGAFYKLPYEVLKAAGALYGPVEKPGFPRTFEPTQVPSFDRGGPVRQTGLARVHAGEWVLSREHLANWASMVGGSPGASNSWRGGTLNLSEGAIQVFASPGMDEATLARLMRQELINVYEELSN